MNFGNFSIGVQLIICHVIVVFGRIFDLMSVKVNWIRVGAAERDDFSNFPPEKMDGKIGKNSQKSLMHLS